MDGGNAAAADEDCSMGHCVDLVASDDDHDAASVLRVWPGEDSIQLRMVSSHSNRIDAAWAFFPHDGAPHVVVDAEGEAIETIG